MNNLGIAFWWYEFCWRLCLPNGCFDLVVCKIFYFVWKTNQHESEHTTKNEVSGSCKLNYGFAISKKDCRWPRLMLDQDQSEVYAYHDSNCNPYLEQLSIQNVKQTLLPRRFIFYVANEVIENIAAKGNTEPTKSNCQHFNPHFHQSSLEFS